MRINDFALERYFAKHEFTAPLLLCPSDCESFALDELISYADQETLELWRKLRLGYTETLGHPVLRSEIAQLYGKDTSLDNVLVLAGAEEGIFIFMNTLLEGGDHVIVQSPTYQSLFEVAKSIGCRVTKWEMDEGNNWELDLDVLKREITAQTRAVVINFPSNPTGYLPKDDFFRALVELCEENDLYLFSDEVYRFLEFDEKDRLPPAADLYEKAVSLGVMSKSFGLAGLRVGWIVTHDNTIFQKMAKFKDYTSICSSAPSEVLAIVGLRSKERLLKRNLQIIRRNLDLLDVFFHDYADSFTWNRPMAGTIGFPRMADRLGRIEDFCENVRSSAGVMLLPASVYEYSGNNFRIGFGRKNMDRALGALIEHLKSVYRGKLS